MTLRKEDILEIVRGNTIPQPLEREEEDVNSY